MNSNLFKRRRFSPDIILLAVRRYCRYPLSFSGVRDLLFERGIHVNAAKEFHSLRTAKTTLQAIEAFRIIKRGDLIEPPGNAAAELHLIKTLFNIAA